jgi:hypothetical protein
MIEDCPNGNVECTFDTIGYCSVAGTPCDVDGDCPGGETCVPDTTIDWRDAHQWAYEWDFDGDDVFDPFQRKFPVLADTDGSLWSRFSPGCTGCADATEELQCQLLGGCQVTTQTQIFDRGWLTVDDTCQHVPYGTTCTPCTGGGYSDSHVRSVLDSITSPVWCGEADE